MPHAADPSDMSPQLPTEIQDSITRLVKPFGLSTSRYDKFIEALVQKEKLPDGSLVPVYSIGMIKKSLDQWHKNNYANRNKSEAYFLGILKRIKGEAAFEKKRLDGVPPVFKG